MKNEISAIFGFTMLWVLIVLNQYSIETLRVNKPERNLFQTSCNTSAIPTVTVTEVMVKPGCPKNQQPKEGSICHQGECRSKAGNCKYNTCEWDSGKGLDVDDFNPPKPTKYTWEKNSITHDKLQAYSKESIPPIFHQSWKTVDVPNKFLDWEKSCLDKHKNWDHLLWTDEDNRQFVAKEYPWLLYTYDRFKNNIQRADFSRYVYLHYYGGIYADLDVECLKNSDELIKDKVIVFGVLGDDDNFVHNIPNAILASIKGHPFWLFLLNRITMLMHQNGEPEEMTGPIILRDAYRLFVKYEQYKNDFYITKPGILYGVDWHKPLPNCVAAFGQHLDTTECKKNYPDAYMVTYWTHSW